MMTKVEKERADCCHKRADHEDNLNSARMAFLMTFNAFMAIAVKLSGDKLIPLMFSLAALVIDCLWLRSASFGVKFIKALRDEGKNRADQVLWLKKFGYKKPGSMSRIMARGIPLVLCIMWGLLSIFFLLNLCNFPFWRSLKIVIP